MRFERYGTGMAKGMAVTFSHLFRKPITTQYPEERLAVSRRIRGNELIWDEERCCGCYTCARSCPQGVINIKTFDNAIVMAPCTQACPAGINVSRYVRFIGEGKPAEAVAIIREKIPFPLVCGLICVHPCETQCVRGKVDEAISIRVLKRFAVEHDTGLWKVNSKIASSTGKRVAIVGSGPGGLTAAYYLAKLGHSVTVFETLPEPGGMMRYGIPAYRLPTEALNADIEEIKAVGVEIKTNSKIESLDKLLEQGYDATLLAVGAHRGIKLPLPGADLEGVLINASLLRDVRLGKEVKIGKRVVVLGGGNVAFDCARTALRLGATDVHLACLEPRDGMLSTPDEIREGEEEGIIIHPSHTFTRLVGDDGHVSGIECLDVRSFEFDKEGRLKLDTIKGSEHILPADNVIFAVGQVPELELVEGVGDIETIRRRTLKVDSATMATGREGVFAAGDVITGTTSVIEAIAVGRKAAISIDKYLGGEGMIDETLAPPQEKMTPLTEAEKWGRVHPPELLPEGRISDFAEVELELSEEMAVKESGRCLRCDLTYPVDKYEADMGYCIFCGLCVEACPHDALFMAYAYERARYRRQELVLNKEDLLLSDKKQPSGYANPKIGATLPQQTLLLDRDRVKK